MSFNATRFSSMHNVARGELAYMGLAEAVRRDQIAEANLRALRLEFERAEWADEMSKYKGAFAYTHLCDMSTGQLSPEAATAPVICYRGNDPIKVTRIRVAHGRRCMKITYNYAL